MFTCNSCGAEFSISREALEKYPGWTPRTCLTCRDKQRKAEGGSTKRPAQRRGGAGGASRGSAGGASRGGSRANSAAGELNLTLTEVLARWPLMAHRKPSPTSPAPAKMCSTPSSALTPP